MTEFVGRFQWDQIFVAVGVYEPAVKYEPLAGHRADEVLLPLIWAQARNATLLR